MQFTEHDSRQCEWCGEPLWYGLKEEPSGWKVYYSCLSEGGCGWERMVGRVSRTAVDHLDEVYREAAAMG